MRENGNPRFPSRIEIRAPESLPQALATAANRGMTTVSEYARQAIINQLRADGIYPERPGNDGVAGVT